MKISYWFVVAATALSGCLIDASGGADDAAPEVDSDELELKARKGEWPLDIPSGCLEGPASTYVNARDAVGGWTGRVVNGYAAAPQCDRFVAEFDLTGTSSFYLNADFSSPSFFGPVECSTFAQESTAFIYVPPTRRRISEWGWVNIPGEWQILARGTTHATGFWTSDNYCRINGDRLEDLGSVRSFKGSVVTRVRLVSLATARNWNNELVSQRQKFRYFAE